MSSKVANPKKDVKQDLIDRVELNELKARDVEARARRVECEIRLIKAQAELNEIRKNIAG